MIIIAIARISGFRLNKTDIVVWEPFWLQVEAAVALITVSITAFRSFLGIKALKGTRETKKRAILVLTPSKITGQISKEEDTGRFQA